MAKISVFVDFSFDAAHSINCFGPDHKCAGLHGHTYSVRLEVSQDAADLQDYIVDYADIKKVWNQECFSKLDHQNINPLFHAMGKESTSENIAVFISDCFNKAGLPLSRVEVRETKTCGAVLETGC